MKIQIEFFKNDFLKAINDGVYEIYVEKNGKSASLYIGESVQVMVRCASHLYDLAKEPEQFGFTDETINDPEIKLVFHLLEGNEQKSTRRRSELQAIKGSRPLLQTGINDHVKRINAKIEALSQFLGEC